MIHPQNLGDKRQSQSCIYCTGKIESREHVPSRVFLDEPFPADLPVINVCEECNLGYSLDEEYAASLIECARVGGVDPSLMQRDKVRRILLRKPQLSDRLKRAMTATAGVPAFSIESERFERVLIKLARGHALFEQNEPRFDAPKEFNFGLLSMFSDESRRAFESIPLSGILPEVGSRAMQRMLIEGAEAGTPWIEVQPDRYRYMSSNLGNVRIVLSEYIWCEAIWD